MHLSKMSVVRLAAVVGVAMWGASPVATMAPVMAAGQAPEQSATSDPYQRSADHFVFTATATSGPQRGEELYFYKCWFCHSRLADRAPALDELGPAMGDRAVAEKIREGGPGMPAYRHTLSDADITDLLSYLRSEACCWEGEEPPPQPRYRAGTRSEGQRSARDGSAALQGGAWGLLRAQADPVEGVGVQLISTQTAIRTTIYTDAEGRFEFPVLAPGSYTLRIPRPMEFRPYVRESIQIDGATRLEDIFLERISDTYLLPPTPDVLAQLTGAEWLLNLPGTGEEKRVFGLACNYCHSYQQIFRNRYDERSWELIVQRMLRSSSSTLFGNRVPTPETLDRTGRPMRENERFLANWLARVSGPGVEHAPLHYLPRERGRSTRVVVTEYELPRELLAPHDLHGDAEGNIWYTAHRSPYGGVLDPRTGSVTEYRIPAKADATPGALPGTHRVWVDEEGLVWFSEGWAQHLTALDPRAGRVVRRFDRRNPGRRLVLGRGSNFAMDSAGYAYHTFFAAGGVQPRVVTKTDSRTGEQVELFQLNRLSGTYDNMITPDGRFWAGGTFSGNMVAMLDTQTGKVWEVDTPTRRSNPARGGFDPQGNAWFGGRGGMLIKLDGTTHRVSEHYPPIPWETFYEAMPDKNGEIWAGGMQSGRFWRFDPTAELWTGYMMPEPYAHDRRTWIDNSTDPVTVWYVDHNGYVVRIQPLD